MIRSFLSFLFPQKKADLPLRASSPDYLMVVLFYGNSVYFGGYEKHPLTDHKDAPYVLEMPKMAALEDILQETRSITHQWVGLQPSHIYVSSQSHPLSPFKNGRLTIAVVDLPCEPTHPLLKRHSLSNLVLEAESSHLSQLVLAELRDAKIC